MMSASLLSDMESFKAANPNGKLEDFIRWYSPRDWIEETDGLLYWSGQDGSEYLKIFISFLQKVEMLKDVWVNECSFQAIHGRQFGKLLNRFPLEDRYGIIILL